MVRAKVVEEALDVNELEIGHRATLIFCPAAVCQANSVQVEGANRWSDLGDAELGEKDQRHEANHALDVDSHGEMGVFVLGVREKSWLAVSTACVWNSGVRPDIYPDSPQELHRWTLIDGLFQTIQPTAAQE
jgi:hypothetical protein